MSTDAYLFPTAILNIACLSFGSETSRALITIVYPEKSVKNIRHVRTERKKGRDFNGHRCMRRFYSSFFNIALELHFGEQLYTRIGVKRRPRGSLTLPASLVS